MATFSIDLPGIVQVTVASHDGGSELANKLARTIAEHTGCDVLCTNNESGRRIWYEVKRVEKWEVTRRG